MIRSTSHFGSPKPLTEQEQVEVSKIRSDLSFDEKNVENIAKLVFNGMKGMRAHPQGELSQDDLRKWTQAILSKKHPDVKFDEANFQKGFRKLDANKNGVIEFEDIKLIVMKKVKKENLYVGK